MSTSKGSPDDGGDGGTPAKDMVSAAAKTLVTPGRYTIATSSVTRSATRRISRGTIGAPSTPFRLRALQRRAAKTPGRDRRKSGRIQRETPIDILRNLGRALAPTSKTIQSSPREEANLKEQDEIDEIDELDNEPVLERPRLSLQIDDDTGEDGEESPDIPPPRLSLAFEEEDITQRSVEYPRRALSEQDRRRFSRMSFGDVRLSENFGDLSRMDGVSEGRDNTITLQQVNDDEGLEDTTVEQGTFDAGGETEDLRRFNLEFNFPTPTAPGPEDTDLVRANDDEEFMLDAENMQPDMGSSPSTGGDAAAGFGFDIHMSDRGSETEALGIVGGGLRDEPLEHGRKGQKTSKHGIPVPNLPSGVVKKLAMRFARTGTGAKLKIKKDVLAAIDQASSWFFEQAGEDLATYSKHARRKIINESDVITLMRRQRHLNSSTTTFSLAQKYLPKELLQEMRLSSLP